MCTFNGTPNLSWKYLRPHELHNLSIIIQCHSFHCTFSIICVFNSVEKSHSTRQRGGGLFFILHPPCAQLWSAALLEIASSHPNYWGQSRKQYKSKSIVAIHQKIFRNFQHEIVQMLLPFLTLATIYSFGNSLRKRLDSSFLKKDDYLPWLSWVHSINLNISFTESDFNWPSSTHRVLFCDITCFRLIDNFFLQ